MSCVLSWCWKLSIAYLVKINTGMKELSIPFFIPNLEEIQQELLNAMIGDYKAMNEHRAFTYPQVYMEKTCPKFMSWLRPRLKEPVRLFRYYITPPGGQSSIHIDGIVPKLPFGLNIPLIGWKNTYHTYYDTPEDNLMTYGGEDGYYGAWLPIDHSKLIVLEDLEISRPYVINNEILHGIRNESDEYRVMFTIRWTQHPTLWRNVEEVMDTTGMFN